MKHLSAIVTALIITAVIGLGIVVVGVSAFTNTNSVPLPTSPSSSLTSNTSNNSSAQSASGNQGQVQQLQQASRIIQQYQNLLVVLQQRGVISTDQNGNIYLPQGSSELH